MQGIQWNWIDPADRQGLLAFGSELDQIGVVEGQVPVVARAPRCPLFQVQWSRRMSISKKALQSFRAMASGSDVESGSSRGNGPFDVMTGCSTFPVDVLVSEFTDQRPDTAPRC